MLDKPEVDIESAELAAHCRDLTLCVEFSADAMSVMKLPMWMASRHGNSILLHTADKTAHVHVGENCLFASRLLQNHTGT